MIRRIVVVGCIAAGPVMAQEFRLPEGCDAYLTVQSVSCTVGHHFTCEGDVPGTQRRVAVGLNGITYFGQIDNETQWLESTHLPSGHTERLEEDPADRASISELLEIGNNSFDFITHSDEIGTTRYVGADSLTGEAVVIDGIELLRTEYRIRAVDADGEETWRAAGNEYISEEWRMFLSGTGVTVVDGESYEDDGTPREFIFPGEQGFLSRHPKYGCRETLSSYEVLQ